jgi:hypothetical protein
MHTVAFVCTLGVEPTWREIGPPVVRRMEQLHCLILLYVLMEMKQMDNSGRINMFPISHGRKNHPKITDIGTWADQDSTRDTESVFVLPRKRKLGSAYLTLSSCARHQQPRTRRQGFIFLFLKVTLQGHTTFSFILFLSFNRAPDELGYRN